MKRIILATIDIDDYILQLSNRLQQHLSRNVDDMKFYTKDDKLYVIVTVGTNVSEVSIDFTDLSFDRFKINQDIRKVSSVILSE